MPHERGCCTRTCSSVQGSTLVVHLQRAAGVVMPRLPDRRRRAQMRTAARRRYAATRCLPAGARCARRMLHLCGRVDLLGLLHVLHGHPDQEQLPVRRGVSQPCATSAWRGVTAWHGHGAARHSHARCVRRSRVASSGCDVSGSPHQLGCASWCKRETGDGVAAAAAHARGAARASPRPP